MCFGKMDATDAKLRLLDWYSKDAAKDPSSLYVNVTMKDFFEKAYDPSTVMAIMDSRNLAPCTPPFIA